MIAIQRCEEPEKLKTSGKQETKALCLAYQAGKHEFKSKDFKSSIYAHKTVKEALEKMQYYKCCFCE
ncbi:MAG: hypothetical protein Q9M50_12765 [Methylococcales bacterium]|nr:hypothetical protein [Methylococcales bacterium]